MRILIAEDDPTSRKMLAAVLRKYGHDVVETANGAEAWEELQTPEAPPVAILDWMMPAMDGLEVVRRVRGMETDCPPYILILTVMNQKSDIVDAMDAGADDYLTKPFDPEELRVRVAVGLRMVEIQAKLASQVVELRQALEHIKALEGILPICSFCKKIRNDQGYWDQVEEFVSKRSLAKFSHSICPECYEKHYSDILEEP